MTHHNHPKCQALCPACEIGPFVRNHYFNGKLLLERDFTDEQRYQIDKLRHHHQRLHGWGVVCGLKVKAHPNKDCICIEPGTAIDCCGHEIVVRDEECVHITKFPVIKTLIDKGDDQPHTLQVCLRYRECPTEEIPVLYDECGSDDTRCAPNRILESYDIDVIVDPLLDVSEQDCEELLWRHLDGCPHCDMPNCVVLATIKDYHAGASIEDTNIDNRKGRRLLPSTQVLKEWIECLLQQVPGGTGPQGPPGSPGKDGLGIEAVQATIIECTATPAAPDIQMINGRRTLVLQIPRGCNGINGADGEKGDPGIDDVDLTIVPCGTPELAKIVTAAATGNRTLKLNIPTGCDTELTHICAINWSHGKKTESSILRDHGLLVAFDHEVRNGDIHKHSFLLLQRLRPEGPSAGCWCEVPAKRVGGVIFRRQCTITEEFEMLDDPNRPVNGAQLLPQEELQQGREYRVVLKGDFIRDEKDKGIDANHLPPWFPSQDYVTGDGVEGGTFESWFLITD